MEVISHCVTRNVDSVVKQSVISIRYKLLFYLPRCSLCLPKDWSYIKNLKDASMIVSGFIEVPISLSLRETCSFASFLLLSFGFSFRHLQKNQDTALRICSWDGCLPAGNVISFERSPWKLWPTLNKFGEILQNPAFHCWLDFWSHSVFQAGFKPKSIWAVLVVGTKQCNNSSIKTVPFHAHELKHAGACPSCTLV